jgi:hypothetical protein
MKSSSKQLFFVQIPRVALKKSHHGISLIEKEHLTGTAMAAELLVKHLLPDPQCREWQ